MQEKLFTKCKYCGKPLTDFASRKRGYGIECYKRHIKKQPLKRNILDKTLYRG